MSEVDRDEHGQFTETVTEQDILKVFDRADAPFLTATELANELSISRQAANYRLKQMHEEDNVGRKQTGARSVGWWATIAPRLSDEARRRADAADQGKAVSLDELEAEFDGDA
jgi:predicted ArsR family transcriptional regulator